MSLAEDRIGTSEEASAQADSPANREFAQAVELHKSGQLEAALRSYARVLELDPCHRDGLNNLGVVLRAQDQDLAALAAYERALVITPDDPGLLANVGNVLRALGRFEAALGILHRAVELAPKAPGVHHNLGLLLQDLGHTDEALTCFERSLAIWPNNTRVKIDQAHSLLAKGDYPAGFRLLEARREVTEAGQKSRLPDWDGGDLKGRMVLLEAEQSVEETIQFIRFAQQVKARNGRVAVAGPPELQSLLTTAEGVEKVVAFGRDLSRASCRLPLMSLPRVLGTTRKTLAKHVPYLRAPRGAGFELTHPASAKLAVGIVWADRAEAPAGNQGGAGLGEFFALLGRPEVAVYSLQTGPRAADLREQATAGLIHDLSNLINGIDDLARVLEQMDLVVTVNTVVAQLAGALGRPVWLLLPSASAWVWALEREASPWYPTMRLFRQPRPGDWRGAFEVAAKKLTALVAG